MFLYSKAVVAAAAATLRGWLDRAAEADLRLSNQPYRSIPTPQVLVHKSLDRSINNYKDVVNT